ncbi:MAG: peptide chain release factor 2, partial [Chitinophagales bacterium]
MIEDPKTIAEYIEVRLNEIGRSLDVEVIAGEIAELEKKTMNPAFWEDNQEAQRVLRRMSELKETHDKYNQLLNQVRDLKSLMELAEDEDEQDIYKEAALELSSLKDQFDDFQLSILFTGEYDRSNAIVSLHAGAGGTDAQDWVDILLRMYSRWAEDNLDGYELWDILPGDEAGIKSTTILIKGKYAYGKMKCERGVHRLIRVSPFDASGRRHTSFAQVSVLPEISDEVEVNIDPEEIKIDTFRSGGAGGQHVNKTDSAVRITHLPSGIVVQCQNERSQHANKLAAMKILQARLHDLKQREHDDNLQKLKGEHRDIAWGSQIRTYVLNPFSLVKDHRTQVETGNVDAVLNGDINQFISAYLHAEA